MPHHTFVLQQLLESIVALIIYVDIKLNDNSKEYVNPPYVYRLQKSV